MGKSRIIWGNIFSNHFDANQIKDVCVSPLAGYWEVAQLAVFYFPQIYFESKFSPTKTGGLKLKDFFNSTWAVKKGPLVVKG